MQKAARLQINIRAAFPLFMRHVRTFVNPKVFTPQPQKPLFAPFPETSPFFGLVFC